MATFEARARCTKPFRTVRVTVEAEDRNDAKWQLHHGIFKRDDGGPVEDIFVDMRTVREVKK